MVWWATVSELPTEELPTSAKPFVKDFQDTRDTTQDDRQRRHTDKILDNIFPIFIYLLINMNTSRQSLHTVQNNTGPAAKILMRAKDMANEKRGIFTFQQWLLIGEN